MKPFWMTCTLIGLLCACSVPPSAERTELPPSAERTELPLGLSYSMSKSEVKNHLKAMATYEIDTGEENTVAYVIPDIINKTETALFVEFDRGKLVEIASGKYKMGIDEFEAYLQQMLLIAEEWKSAGVTTVVESKINNMYIYKDMRSYMTISGSKTEDKYQVSVSFTEKNYQER